MALHRRMRGAAALSAGVLAVGMLAGCSGDKSSDSTSTSKELTYWSMWKQGEPQQKVLQAAIDKFTEQTGIKVSVQWSGRQVLQQVVPRLNTGNPPDLVDGSAGDIQTSLGSVNAALGLADVYSSQIPGESQKVSDVIPLSLTSAARSKDGQPTTVPYEIIGSTLWFNGKTNPDLVGKPQLKWSEFTAMSDKLKSQGQTPIALDGDVTGYDAYWLTWSVVRNGGVGLLNKACQDKTGAAWDDPAFLAAAQDIQHIIASGYLPHDFNGTKFPAQQTAWASGTDKTGFLLMGTWAPSETGQALAKSGKDVNSVISYNFMPFPAADGGKGNTAAMADTIGFAVPSQAKHADAAKKFIEFFMNKDQLSGIATQAENLTPRTDIPAPASLADYAKELAAANGNTFSAIDGCEVTVGKWTSDVWNQTAADFFNGKIQDAASFVKALKDRSKQYYSSNG